MMRKKLSLVRQSNPAFKNMADDQMRQYADQIELGTHNCEFEPELSYTMAQQSAVPCNVRVTCGDCL